MFHNFLDPYSNGKSLLNYTGYLVVVDSGASPHKKARSDLSREMKQLIGEDDLNKKIWDELLAGATNNSVRYSCLWDIVNCHCD